jgi:hypothetical protein
MGQKIWMKKSTGKVLFCRLKVFFKKPILLVTELVTDQNLSIRQQLLPQRTS